MVVSAVLLMLFVTCLIFGICKLLAAKREYDEGRSEYEKLEETAVRPTEKEEWPRLDIDLASLQEINPDLVCWLDIPCTEISYPVVQGDTNEQYLRTTFEGKSNVAGAVFIDCRNSASLGDRNIIIYGHRMNDGTMFTQLKNYTNEQFLSEHGEIHIYTESGVAIYTVFSVQRTDTDGDCYKLLFESDKEYCIWLRLMSDASIAPCRRSIGAGVITLSTCVNTDSYERLVVQAVRTKFIENRGGDAYSVG